METNQLKSSQSTLESMHQGKWRYRLRLSPKPLATGYAPVIPSKHLSQKNAHFIDLSMTTGKMWLLQCLIFAIPSLMALPLYGLYLHIERYITGDISTPSFIHLLVLFLIPALLVVPVVVWCVINDGAKESNIKMPIRFHRQRQEILFSYIYKNKPTPKIPNVLDKDWNIFSMVMVVGLLNAAATFIVFWCEEYFQEGTSNSMDLFISIACLFVCIYFVSVLVKPWPRYFKEKKDYKEESRIIAVPWEEVIVEYKGVDIEFMKDAAISFMTLNPNSSSNSNIKKEKYLTQFIKVDSEAEAISLYEFIRQYMDSSDKRQEPDFFKDAVVGIPDYNLTAYKRLLTKRWETNPVTYFVWRLFYLITLRYWMHLLYGYMVDTRTNKRLNKEDIKTWSAEIPKKEWKTTSAKVKALNQELEALYAQGYEFEGLKV